MRRLLILISLLGFGVQAQIKEPLSPEVAATLKTPQVVPAPSLADCSGGREGFGVKVACAAPPPPPLPDGATLWTGWTLTPSALPGWAQQAYRLPAQVWQPPVPTPTPDAYGRALKASHAQVNGSGHAGARLVFFLADELSRQAALRACFKRLRRRGGGGAP